MSSKATEHKEQGNTLFLSGDYSGAINCYTKAIAAEKVDVFFTNRALCYLRTKQFEDAKEDCISALELNKKSLKAHYYMAHALIEGAAFGDENQIIRQHLTNSKYISLEDNLPLDTALYHFNFAFQLALQQRSNATKEYGDMLLKVKKMKWNKVQDKKKRSEDGLYDYVLSLFDKDLELYKEDVSKLEEIKQRKEALKRIFSKASHDLKDKTVPDFLLSKLTLSLLRDPVITPSGITYDREEILEHLNKVGRFDPFTRKPLQSTDLVNNLAMRECLEWWVEREGWVLEF